MEYWAPGVVLMRSKHTTYMYPSASPNYYAPLAEPAIPSTEHEPTTHTTYQPGAVAPTLQHATTNKQSAPTAKRVNWARTLAPNQDKPHFPHRQETANALRLRHHLRLLATAHQRKTHRGQAIIDSGATGHYGSSEGEWIQTKTPSTNVVGLADGTPVAASVKALLPYPDLPTETRDGDIIPGLKNDLLSVKRLADAKLTTILHDKGAEVYPNNALTIIATTGPILRGCRDKAGLWRVSRPNQNNATKAIRWNDITAQPRENVNAVYDLPSIGNAIRWHHASLGFPTKDTLIKAINAGFLKTWPLLTQHNVAKHFPDSHETTMGHTNQQRQGVRSTKPKPNIVAATAAAVTATNTQQTPTHAITATVYQFTHTIYSDQTGRLPCRTRNGHQYIMVVLHDDSNYAFVEPMKNKTDEEMQRAYTVIIKRIKHAKLTVTKHILDNECSAAMKELITQTCKYELVPPGCHRRNRAEVTIKAFKQHLISVFAGLDDNFPMTQWDKLLPQVEITLNLLRASKATPSISAYEHVHGPYDYNRNPLAPIGCAVHIHNQPAKRGTWAPHTQPGWYLGTSFEHYRCHRVLPKATNTSRVCETIIFNHKKYTCPSITPADYIADATHMLTNAVKAANGIPTAAASQLHQLETIIEMYKQRGAEPKPTVSISTKKSTLEPIPLTPTACPKPPSPMNRVTPPVQMPPPPPVAAIPPPPIVPPEMQHAPNPQPQLPNAVRGLGPVLEGGSNTRVATRATFTQHLNSVINIQQPTIATRTLLPTLRGNKQEHLNLLACAVFDEESGRMLNYRQLLTHPAHKEIWTTSSADEFGRLAQGVGGRIKGTDTINFIPYNKIPNERRRDITYGRFVCDIRLAKENPYRTRLTVGGDKINYPGEVATPTCELLLAKIFFNSVISTPNARFATADISNFYLNTPMERYEYVRLSMLDIPEEIICEYNLSKIASPDNTVYIEVRKGMYGLPQAGLLAQQLLEQRLNKHGYSQDPLIPGFWTHTTRPVQFILTVDDFGIKYVGKEHAEHLLGIIQENYKLTIDWTGSKYIGLTLDWDYENNCVHVSMPGYVERALAKFQHPKPKKPQNQPHPHIPPKYGATTQYATDDDTTPPVGPEQTKFIQQVSGTFMYLARAVDPTILTALSAIASHQSAPTERTLQRAKQLLDYLATQEDAVITYRASPMILAAHSDAGYLNEPKARSRAGGIFYLTTHDTFPPPNGAILNIAQIIKHVMSSAAEAELGALYINAKEAVYIRLILERMGHPQNATPIQTDNSTAAGVINSSIQPKRTKAMDMRFHWLRDRETLKQFRIYWRPGKQNLADYWTKHHPASHHKNMRPEILTPLATLHEFQNRLTSKKEGNKSDPTLKNKERQVYSCEGVLVPAGTAGT